MRNRGKRLWLFPKLINDVVASAQEQFRGTNVSITKDGRCVLGSPIALQQFINYWVITKVQTWGRELTTLAEFACTFPQDAYLVLPIVLPVAGYSSVGHVLA